MQITVSSSTVVVKLPPQQEKTPFFLSCRLRWTRGRADDDQERGGKTSHAYSTGGRSRQQEKRRRSYKQHSFEADLLLAATFARSSACLQHRVQQ